MTSAQKTETLHKFGENTLFHYKVIEMHGFASRQPSYGIQAEVVEGEVCTYMTLIPSISYNRVFVDSLVQRCNRGQLDPIHLLDVVLDALS